MATLREATPRGAWRRTQKVAMVGVAVAILSACGQNQMTHEEYAQLHPESVSQPHEGLRTPPPAPATEDSSPKPSTEDRLRNLGEKLSEKGKEYYGNGRDYVEDNDWRGRIEEKLEEAQEYLDEYTATPPAVGGNSARGKYDREAFKHWTDTSLYRNSCDTRQDILQRDLENVRYDSDGCTVLSGDLRDPFTGETLHYQRGQSTVDIDHTVALEDAWERGAWAWTDAQREAFANDPANLVAVSASHNRAKGSRSPSEWMPINRSYACSYGEQYLDVSQAYRLELRQSDIDSVASACRR